MDIRTHSEVEHPNLSKDGDTSAPIPRPISDHGIVGDLATLALVAGDGAIDFMCWPNFDSPTIFAALLDPDRGGLFEILLDIPDVRIVQHYRPDTNVLVTRWMGENASAELTDFMAVREDSASTSTKLVRRLKVTCGTVAMALRCAPRFDYARQKETAEVDGHTALWRPKHCDGIKLTSTLPLQPLDGDVICKATLTAGETADFLLTGADEEPMDFAEVAAFEEATIQYWQDWAAQSSYRGRWREIVTRSALTLKLMTSRRHGSIIVVLSFGLSDASGGIRNWDYRATWIRDASFTVYALMRLGYQQEAQDFTSWIGKRAMRCGANGKLDIMYAVDGSTVADEVSLDHLSGYGGARPVRIGNGAAKQVQLDIYGELMDAVYLSNKYGHAISHDGWNGVRDIINYVCEHWEEPDAGIWEMRRGPQHFLHSRLMCWVAVDRAIRLASKRSLAAPFSRWIDVRNNIYEDIWANFWNEEKGHFVQTKGGDTLDASLLLMPLVRFVSATDPRWLATLNAIGDTLADDGLVHRYKSEDGLSGQEGSFSACSFWYAECLARAGDLKKARSTFEALLNYANHLGLYAEEFDHRGELLGNFPQAFTHLALISAAFYLDRELDGKSPQQWRP